MDSERYDAVKLLGEIHGKVSTMYDWQMADRNRQDKLEQRVRKLEIKQYTLVGVAAGISAAISDAGRKVLGYIWGNV